MKAAVFRSHNRDPNRVVKIEDIDVPKINPNEVLIKIESASYNYDDLWAIWGEPIKNSHAAYIWDRHRWDDRGGRGKRNLAKDRR